nr:MAG TPA: Flagellar M-ring protein, Flagellar motor motor, switch complex, MOTOR [Caudoviricetes sp.]
MSKFSIYIESIRNFWFFDRGLVLVDLVYMWQG